MVAANLTAHVDFFFAGWLTYLFRTAAHLYNVVPNIDTSNVPTLSEPVDTPEQPQTPEQNDGDSDVEEIAP